MNAKAKELIRNVQADLDKFARNPEKLGISGEEFEFLVPQLFRAQEILLDHAITHIELEEAKDKADSVFADPTIEENFEYEAPLIG